MSGRGSIIVLVGAGLVACGGPEGPAAVSSNASVAAPTRATSETAEMVSAVSNSKASEAMDLKFAIASRPEPGRPIEIDLAVVPKVSDATIRVIVQNTDGLTIQSGQELNLPKGAPTGVPVMHRLTVMPSRDGIFSISAVALIDTDTSSVSRTFAIPIIVGQGVTPAELPH